jgi:hypothetical protein
MPDKPQAPAYSGIKKAIARHSEMKVQYRELSLEWRSLAEQLEQTAAPDDERAAI